MNAALILKDRIFKYENCHVLLEYLHQKLYKITKMHKPNGITIIDPGNSKIFLIITQ